MIDPHEKLLAEVEALQARCIPSMGDALAALRAVVERHRPSANPVPVAAGGWHWCHGCAGVAVARWPCADIRAIARELGMNG